MKFYFLKWIFSPCESSCFFYTSFMASFDTLFFEQHIARDEKIEKVFHRHIFVMLEDLVVWMFF